MNSLPTHFYNYGSQAVPLIKTHQNPIYQSTLQASSHSGFPILAISVLAIALTLSLILMYFILVMKCRLFTWHRPVDLLSQFSISQTRRSEDPLMDYSQILMQTRGLDQSLIREIPTVRFKRRGGRGEDMSRGLFGCCMVCLNEFKEGEALRVLPHCTHAFHLGCIDIWLQGNANCPLCRSSISGATHLPVTQTVAPTSSPQESQVYVDSLMGSDEDFVIIELGGGAGGEFIRPSQRQQERDASGSNSRGEDPEIRRSGSTRDRNMHHVSSMGDECIDTREKDDQFLIQPIRRSFSLGSAADRHLYLSVQEIVQHNKYVSEARSVNECSSRVQRSCFSFRHARGSRNAVCPV